MNEFSWPAILSPLLAGESLSSAQSAWAMERIMEGEATPAQFGAFVAGLRAKGETVDEIRGLVETMRRFAQRIELDFPVVDTCGTGGDRAGTINVSTIAAFVVAGAGAKVAKHGNRSASSQCGSADLLEELGVKIDADPTQVARCIRDAGIGFCFAPVFHPSMRHAGPPRRELGVPTIFNFLGPLTNPAGARHQVLGVSDERMAPKMVDVLNDLGTKHALVVHGEDGLDEISTASATKIWELQGGKITEGRMTPEEFGLTKVASDAIKGGTPAENAKVALEVLGGAKGAHRDVVAINAAAGIVAADLARSMSKGLEMAFESIDAGKALRALDGLIELSNQ